MSERCFALLCFRGVVDGGRAPQNGELDQIQRPLFQPSPPILHAPLIQHAERPDDVRHTGSPGGTGRGKTAEREEGVNVDSIIIRHVLAEPLRQGARTLCRTRCSCENKCSPLPPGRRQVRWSGTSSRLPGPSSSVVATVTLTPQPTRARVKNGSAKLGPPCFGETDGMTWRTRNVVTMFLPRRSAIVCLNRSGPNSLMARSRISWGRFTNGCG